MMNYTGERRNRTACKYDEDRKKETLEKLYAGLKRLKRRIEYEDKPITVNSLSKETGVSRSTIKKHPTIMNRLYEEQERVRNVEGIVLKSSTLKISKIHTFKQAVATASMLSGEYNDAAQKYNQALKKISELQLQVARLQIDKAKLEHAFESYQQTKGDNSER